MKTRKQYLNKEITHQEYYSQFVNKGFNGIKGWFRNRELENTDGYLFEIPLKVWDKISPPLGTNESMKLCGDCLTLAGKVCIAKEAARQYLKTI